MMNSSGQSKEYDRSRITVLEPQSGSKHTHTLIFMHGLGDNGENYKPLFGKGGPLNVPGLKVLLPTAPESPVTCNGGVKMTSWFDIKEIL